MKSIKKKLKLAKIAGLDFIQSRTIMEFSTLFTISSTSLSDILLPHFYIVNLGFTGVYIIFSYFC